MTHEEWAENESHWTMRLYDRICQEQAWCVERRRGSRYGICVDEDDEAREWRRLERLRGRVLMWINEMLRELAEDRKHMGSCHG
jgi:hypothetical protein